uniref:Cytochrome b5 n=1 Tax=Steinernema glaseri TaxID=37863 RepID=A0A1I7ZS90_9BILA
MQKERPTRQFTRQEVAEHNTTGTAWTIIKNKVYDVTTFLEEVRFREVMEKERPTRQFTRQEVAEHNTTGTAWTIIKNKVYDVTTFLEEHPGGLEILLEQAGQDGTEAFQDVGHSGDARAKRDTFFIGDIVESERTKYMDDNVNWDPKSPEYYNFHDQKTAVDYVIYIFFVVLLIAAGYFFLFM